MTTAKRRPPALAREPTMWRTAAVCAKEERWSLVGEASLGSFNWEEKERGCDFAESVPWNWSWVRLKLELENANVRFWRWTKLWAGVANEAAIINPNKNPQKEKKEKKKDEQWGFLSQMPLFIYIYITYLLYEQHIYIFYIYKFKYYFNPHIFVYSNIFK